MVFQVLGGHDEQVLSGPVLWAFMVGHGLHGKTLAELKGEFALDVVPTNHYGAIIGHNLLRSFQLHALVMPKPRPRKRTYAYVLQSMPTPALLVINRAGQLSRINDRQVLH